MLQKAFPFKIQTIQTDNGTEITYKYISDNNECPFDTVLREAGIEHKLIPPRTPWHKGKAERSHRNDQRYFYDWEQFDNLEEFNAKLATHLIWSNNKTMRTLGRKKCSFDICEETTRKSRKWKSFSLEYFSFWVRSIYNAEFSITFFQKLLTNHQQRVIL